MSFVFSKDAFNNHNNCALLRELLQLKNQKNDEENLLLEVRNIVKRSLYNLSNISDNLDMYSQRLYFLDDEELDENLIFTLEEIENICIKYRMHFANYEYYKNSIPSVAEVKLEYLNDTYQKKLNHLKIISYRENFLQPNHHKNYGILFAPTLNGHYYLIHQWGHPIPKYRKYLWFPLRSFETLAISIILFTLVVDLILPTYLITLDHTATYWSGYRLGVFFHLLIFFSGLTMFIVVAFFKNVSKNIWHSP